MSDSRSGSLFFALDFLFPVISLLAVFILSCRVRPPPSVVVSSSPWPRQLQQHNSSDAFPAVTNTWKSDWLRRLPWGFIWKQKTKPDKPTLPSSTVSCADCSGGKPWVWSALLLLQSLEHGDVQKLLSHAPHVDLQWETPDSGSFCQSCIVTSYIRPRETFSHSSLTLCDYAKPEAGENCGFEDKFQVNAQKTQQREKWQLKRVRWLLICNCYIFIISETAFLRCFLYLTNQQRSVWGV